MTTAHYHVFTAAKAEGEQIYFASPSTEPFALFYSSKKGDARKALEELAEHVMADAILRSQEEHFSVGFTYTPPSPLQAVEVEGVGEMNTHELDLSLHQVFSNLIHNSYRRLQNPKL